MVCADFFCMVFYVFDDLDGKLEMFAEQYIAFIKDI